jgi:uncharacterized iron-regulated protein
MKKSCISIIVAFLFVLSFTAPGYAGGAALRVKDGKAVSSLDLLGAMRKADIVFVGELHDRMEDHIRQLEIIEAFHAADVPMAIGLEMFRADSQKDLDAWVSSKLDPDRFLSLYYQNWRLPWPLYREIFEYAREHGIPMVGLNVPERISRKVARSGFSSLTPEERQHLPAGISCNVDPAYMDFIRRAYSGHGKEGRSFVHFCEAQMVWDKAMAWHLVAYLKRHPGTKIVVLTGIGHAWKRGIPEQVAEQGKFSSLVILPSVPGEVERGRITERDADYLFLD